MTDLSQQLDEQHLSYQTISAVSNNTFFFPLEQIIIEV